MSFLNETVAPAPSADRVHDTFIGLVREISVPEMGQEVVDQFVYGWRRQVLPGSLSTTGGVGSE
jgi:hypothetical protein